MKRLIGSKMTDQHHETEEKEMNTRLISVKEAAGILGVSVFYVRELIRKGEIRGFLAGSRRGGYKTTVGEVESFIEKKLTENNSSKKVTTH